mmetsp:Transcript_67640/g.220197  ORF Transcript_67640/g.220197 Transcript_67640/m.220197 type:complete len:210 (-) Transcript_67640:91-720(-)
MPEDSARGLSGTDKVQVIVEAAIRIEVLFRLPWQLQEEAWALEQTMFCGFEYGPERSKVGYAACSPSIAALAIPAIEEPAAPPRAGMWDVSPELYADHARSKNMILGLMLCVSFSVALLALVCGWRRSRARCISASAPVAKEQIQEEMQASDALPHLAVTLGAPREERPEEGTCAVLGDELLELGTCAVVRQADESPIDDPKPSDWDGI